jgi:hypothetical protein
MSDRDLAQQWLAKRIQAGAAAYINDWDAANIAAAILDAPGVEVSEEVGDTRESGWLPADFRWGTPAVERRLVIRLPAEPIERSGVAAHQHTEEGS